MKYKTTKNYTKNQIDEITKLIVFGFVDTKRKSDLFSCLAQYCISRQVTFTLQS